MLLLLILSLHNAGHVVHKPCSYDGARNIFIVIILITIKIIGATYKFAERYLITHTSRYYINILSI